MLLYLLVGGLARIRCRLDGLDLSVSVRLDVELLAFLTVLDVQEHVLVPHVLICNDAEGSALFARTYRVPSCRPLASYSALPCRVKLDRLTSPTYRFPSRSYSATALRCFIMAFTTPGATT